MTTTRYHIGASRQLLLMQIKEHGAQVVLDNPPPDKTDEEVMQMIRDDGREVFCDRSCDNKDETGRCQGHPVTD